MKLPILSGTIIGVLLLAQVFALVYAQQAHARGDADVERTHRDAAINATVLLMMIALLGSTFEWYSTPALRPLYKAIATNLKPKDKQGNGWLEAQAYANEQEAKSATWMFKTIHKTLLAAIVSGLLGVVGGVASKAFEAHVKGNIPQAYAPPSGPRSPWSGRKAY